MGRRERDSILGLGGFSYDLSHIVGLLNQLWVIVLIIEISSMYIGLSTRFK